MDFLKAAAIYIPAYLIGRAVSEYFDFQPFLMGWVCGGSAIFLRTAGPMFFRAESYR